jgi:hypothetical protein
MAAELDVYQEGFTEQEARDMWAQFRENRCQHCGGAHARACPRVRRLVFHASGQLAEVVFWPTGKWSPDHVQWPEDLPDDPDA